MSRSLFALHGFSGNGEVFGRLAEGVVAPLLSGHGPSPDLTAKNFREELIRLAERASRLPSPRWITGYSQGARVALGMLVEFPELFERAYLFGAHPGLEFDSEREVRLRMERGWQRLLRSSGLEAFVDEFEKLPIFDSQQSWSERKVAEQRRVRLNNTAEGLIHALEVLGLASMPNYRPRLNEILVPVHLVAGSLDEKFCALHRAIGEALPTATLEVLPGVGHNPLLEAAERVRTLLLPD